MATQRMRTCQNIGIMCSMSDLKQNTPLILIVDDDPGSVHQLNGLARGLGRVRFCMSGEEALRMVREERPDMVLLDMELPGISGEETCAALRQHLEPAELPIIIITAHGHPAREARALALGANDFIIKPFNPPVARARMETHLALKRRTDELLRLTQTDELTGLANRRMFDLVLEREWKRAVRNQMPLALLMIDVDHFKAYNDAYGHPQGDACLKQVATAMRSVSQRAGDQAARYGGEEFAMLLPHTTLRDAGVVADRLHQALRGCNIPHMAAGPTGRLTVSIGVSALEMPPRFNHNGALTEVPPVLPMASPSLIGAADLALYQAKASGRNQTALRGIDAKPD